MNAEEICNVLVSKIKDYFDKHNFKKAVIGLSGGIDSSVTTYLAVKALGNENVTVLLMPDLEVTSKQTMEDSEEVVKSLKIMSHTIPINNFVNIFTGLNVELIIKENIHALANVKARARMMLLYYFANMENALVIGTSDKSESVLGYATKYGDNASDILAVGDLWKTEVTELGRFLGVPDSILNKKPTAELVHGQTDEGDLGAPYEVLDKMLKLHFEEKLSMEEIIEKGFDKKIVENAFERMKVHGHKSTVPELIKVS